MKDTLLNHPIRTSLTLIAGVFLSLGLGLISLDTVSILLGCLLFFCINSILILVKLYLVQKKSRDMWKNFSGIGNSRPKNSKSN